MYICMQMYIHVCLCVYMCVYTHVSLCACGEGGVQELVGILLVSHDTVFGMCGIKPREQWPVGLGPSLSSYIDNRRNLVSPVTLSSAAHFHVACAFEGFVYAEHAQLDSYISGTDAGVTT